jgi:16S rRNA (cytidine1402-2'-O)-methyltransferase
VDPSALRDEVAALVAAGSTRRDAIDAVAASTGLARRVVYAAAVTSESR